MKNLRGWTATGLLTAFLAAGMPSHQVQAEERQEVAAAEPQPDITEEKLLSLADRLLDDLVCTGCRGVGLLPPGRERRFLREVLGLGGPERTTWPALREMVEKMAVRLPDDLHQASICRQCCGVGFRFDERTLSSLDGFREQVRRSLGALSPEAQQQVSRKKQTLALARCFSGAVGQTVRPYLRADATYKPSVIFSEPGLYRVTVGTVFNQLLEAFPLPERRLEHDYQAWREYRQAMEPRSLQRLIPLIGGARIAGSYLSFAEWAGLARPRWDLLQAVAEQESAISASQALDPRVEQPVLRGARALLGEMTCARCRGVGIVTITQTKGRKPGPRRISTVPRPGVPGAGTTVKRPPPPPAKSTRKHICPRCHGLGCRVPGSLARRYHRFRDQLEEVRDKVSPETYQEAWRLLREFELRHFLYKRVVAKSRQAVGGGEWDDTSKRSLSRALALHELSRLLPASFAFHASGPEADASALHRRDQFVALPDARRVARQLGTDRIPGSSLSLADWAVQAPASPAHLAERSRGLPHGQGHERLGQEGESRSAEAVLSETECQAVYLALRTGFRSLCNQVTCAQCAGLGTAPVQYKRKKFGVPSEAIVAGVMVQRQRVQQALGRLLRSLGGRSARVSTFPGVARLDFRPIISAARCRRYERVFDALRGWQWMPAGRICGECWGTGIHAGRSTEVLLGRLRERVREACRRAPDDWAARYERMVREFELARALSDEFVIAHQEPLPWRDWELMIDEQSYDNQASTLEFPNYGDNVGLRFRVANAVHCLVESFTSAELSIDEDRKARERARTHLCLVPAREVTRRFAAARVFGSNLSYAELLHKAKPDWGLVEAVHEQELALGCAEQGDVETEFNLSRQAYQLLQGSRCPACQGRGYLFLSTPGSEPVAGMMPLSKKLFACARCRGTGFRIDPQLDRKIQDFRQRLEAERPRVSLPTYLRIWRMLRELELGSFLARELRQRLVVATSQNVFSTKALTRWKQEEFVATVQRTVGALATCFSTPVVSPEADRLAQVRLRQAGDEGRVRRLCRLLGVVPIPESGLTLADWAAPDTDDTKGTATAEPPPPPPPPAPEGNLPVLGRAGRPSKDIRKARKPTTDR